MGLPIDHEHMHRTAKLFMDNGKAATQDEAIEMLAGFGLGVRISEKAQQTRNGQIALLTLVNAARRTFLGGIEVADLIDAPLLLPLAEAPSVREAVQELGGKLVSSLSPSLPLALIGDVEHAGPGLPAWHLLWSGWCGGVIPARNGSALCDDGAMPLAPVIAACACIGEAFSYHAGDHPMAGRRSCGFSLWSPKSHWLDADAKGPGLTYLPSALWLIGMGNLGQATAWLLACLPYGDRGQVRLMLQDFDRIAPSNDSTSVLSSLDRAGKHKTRVVASWLEQRGMDVAINEQRFGTWTRVSPHDPPVALCGVDNPLSRASLERAGFGLVVEAGLGGGPEGFRAFAMHTFPSALNADRLWSQDKVPGGPNVSDQPAYQALKAKGLDTCGLAQLASRSVGVPFVGLVAAAFALSELLRRLNGGRSYQSIAGSLVDPDGIEAVTMTSGPYAFGHVGACS
ncbi:hypothetical protein [Hyphomicrobium sp. 99]|uniref:hypothetical protein n=1 Tax=Hyphomicrobium sp. 99 TaxID=1163419 RepID=UPI0006973A22|nr:hypothetical protein [Hyphomicrobium sp. 99]